MRVLLVTHKYPPFGVAGVERLSEQTARSLTALGHEVTVLTRRETAAPPTPTIESTLRDGVQVVTVYGGGSTRERFPALQPLFGRTFERTLLDVHPDVVLISHLLGHSPAYVALAHRWGIPVAVELHDFYAVCERGHLERRSGELCRGPEGGEACAVHCFPHLERSQERWALRTDLFRRALEQADALICPSSFVADYFRSSLPGLDKPLHVIGNGVELIPSYAASPDAGGAPLRLGFVGILIPAKGAHVVLEALHMARLERVRLTLFGTPTQPYFGELLDTAEQIPGLELRAYGEFSHVELPVLLSDIDAVIVPSLVWETYSIVAHEVLACGIPVIASRIGALPEAIRDGENGILFEPGSASQLAAILDRLDTDRAHLSALRKGIAETDWISVEARTHQLVDLLDRLIAENQRETGPVPELGELAILRDSLDDPAASFGAP